MGPVGNILVGVLGAFLGGLALSRLLPSAFNLTSEFYGFNIGSLIVVFVGAVVLPLVVELFVGWRRTRGSPAWATTP